MNDQQLFQREQKIDTYTTRTAAENIQEEQQHDNLFGNPPTYESSDQLKTQHTSGMDRYMERNIRDIFKEENPGAPESVAEDMVDTALRQESNLLREKGLSRSVARQEQYYFRRSERSAAKAQRYQKLSQSKSALRQHANAHSNRSASKRARKAKDASKAYNKVAKLQSSFENDLRNRYQGDAAQGQPATTGEWKAQNLADYNRLEEITNARIQALTYAAQAKSISKQQEDYSIQKGTLTNYLVLRDSLERLIQENSGTPEEAQLKAKQADLNKKIEETSKKIDRLSF